MTKDTNAALIRRPDGTYIMYDDAKPRDQLAHDLVGQFFPLATDAEDGLKTLKKDALSEMRAFQEVMFQDYNVDVTGKEGGFSVKSLCGTMKVEMSIAKHVTFGPEIKAAQELLKQFLAEELEGSRDTIHQIFSDAFALNKNGRLDTAGILSLRKFRFDHPLWARAMDAIDDALCSDGSTTYLRFYRIDTENKVEKLVPLDLAKV